MSEFSDVLMLALEENVKRFRENFGLLGFLGKDAVLRGLRDGVGKLYAQKLVRRVSVRAFCPACYFRYGFKPFSMVMANAKDLYFPEKCRSCGSSSLYYVLSFSPIREVGRLFRFGNIFQEMLVGARISGLFDEVFVHKKVGGFENGRTLKAFDADVFG